MLKLKSKKAAYGISLPTELNEITPEILAGLVENIRLPKYYAVIALAFEVKLFDIAMNLSGNNTKTVNVIPLLAKTDASNLETIQGAIGDKLVIERSSLERSTHLHVTSVITNASIERYIRSDDDLRRELMAGGKGDGIKPLNLDKVTDSARQKEQRIADKSPRIYSLDFKIIPISEIRACIAVDSTTVDVFKTSDILVN